MSSAGSSDFRDALAHFASGVTIATVIAPDGKPHGLTVSAFCSVSIEPPMILICIDYSCAFLAYFRASTTFAVNILRESQLEYSVIFAEKPEGRFEGISWFTRVTGAPLLPGCLANVECRVSSILEAGDHAIFVAEVVSAYSDGGRPLVYFNRDYRSLT